MTGDLLVVSVTVNGTQIQDLTAGYEVTRYSRGASELRRHTVESDDVAGRGLVDWTEDTMLGVIGVKVTGATATQVASRRNALIATFRPSSTYLITATMRSTAAAGDMVETWTCEPADYDLNDEGEVDAELLFNHVEVVTFTWPHSPIVA